MVGCLFVIGRDFVRRSNWLPYLDPAPGSQMRYGSVVKFWWDTKPTTLAISGEHPNLSWVSIPMTDNDGERVWGFEGVDTWALHPTEQDFGGDCGGNQGAIWLQRRVCPNTCSRSTNDPTDPINRERTYSFYFNKWEWKKNAPNPTMRWVKNKVEKRKLEGKDTCVSYYDKEINDRKISTFKKRKYTEEEESQIFGLSLQFTILIPS